MKNWKKFLAGFIVGAVVSTALAWGYYGNAADGQGRFKAKISPISIIKMIRSTK